MMNKQIAGVVLAASIVAGVGAGVFANAITEDTPAAAIGDTPSAAPTSQGTGGQGAGAPQQMPVAFQLDAGSVGPVKVGMSKDDALATGLFEPGVSPVEGCPAPPLAWTSAHAKTFDVQTLGNGEITSIGVLSAGPTTAHGLGVGSTYGEVRRVLDDAEPVEAGYDQSGMFEFDGEDGGWIGFLFNSTLKDLEDSDQVTFVEVTKGSQPGLMRDGC